MATARESGATPAAVPRQAAQTTFHIVWMLSFCHLLNDMMQSLIAAIYPVLKDAFRLDFSQVGLITLVLQMSGALLQPVVGLWADRRPRPYALTVGMASTLVGILLLSQANRFALVLVAAGLVGLGSSVFHPESSRIARAASGGRHGFAQSLFQVGGNFGQSLGPLLAAFVVIPRGQGSIAWFSVAALVAMAGLWHVGTWFSRTAASRPASHRAAVSTAALSSRTGRAHV